MDLLILLGIIMVQNMLRRAQRQRFLTSIIRRSMPVARKQIIEISPHFTALNRCEEGENVVAQSYQGGVSQ